MWYTLAFWKENIKSQGERAVADHIHFLRQRWGCARLTSYGMSQHREKPHCAPAMIQLEMLQDKLTWFDSQSKFSTHGEIQASPSRDYMQAIVCLRTVPRLSKVKRRGYNLQLPFNFNWSIRYAACFHPPPWTTLGVEQVRFLWRLAGVVMTRKQQRLLNWWEIGRKLLLIWRIPCFLWKKMLQAHFWGIYRFTWHKIGSNKPVVF